MGRYYDEKISLDGLDPANPLFGPVIQAAQNVNDTESQFFVSRKALFNEMNFGSFGASPSQIEAKYESTIPNVSIYNYKSVFDSINPSSNTGSGFPRRIQDNFKNVEFSNRMPLADYLYKQDEEEDDDGNYGYFLADDVYEYTMGRGEPNVDTLYPNLRVFTSAARTFTDYYEILEDAEGEEFFSPFINVYVGFAQVPLHWQAKSGFSSNQLQIMYAAGLGYNAFVGPAINDFNSKFSQYINNGGGNLDDDFYDGGTPTAPWQDFQGTSVSYNRPKNLPPELIKETRGL